MGYNTITKGSDEIISISLSDETGAPIDVSKLDEIIVRVYQTQGAILQENKLSDETIEIVDDADNKIKFPLHGQSTLHISTKRLFLEIVIEQENADFVGGVKKTRTSNIELADLQNPATND